MVPNNSITVWVRPTHRPCSEHKLRNFKARYLTKKQTIREYSNLGKFAHFNSTKSKWFTTFVPHCPNMSTHVWSVSSLSSGPWNCAIYARYTAHRHAFIMWVVQKHLLSFSWALQTLTDTSAWHHHLVTFDRQSAWYDIDSIILWL
jgi:hypothetical protein